MDVSEAVQRRMSVRAFKPDTPPAAVVRAILESAPLQEEPEYAVYPPDLWEPYRTRRFRNAEQLYASIGIPREDKAARLRQMAKNASFFGAPVGIFLSVDRRMGPPKKL